MHPPGDPWNLGQASGVWVSPQLSAQSGVWESGGIWEAVLPTLNLRACREQGLSWAPHVPQRGQTSLVCALQPSPWGGR